MNFLPKTIPSTNLALFVIAAVVILAIATTKSFLISSEGFADYVSAPMSFPNTNIIGTFDGVRLNPGNGSSWRGPPPNEPHLPVPSPSGDGMYLFYKNQCKPECCPSSYTCDGGCVCTTEADRAIINGRGGNRTGPDADI